MKAIIYAGIGLFSVASVYGIVDYYNTQKKGTLDRLYKDPEEVVVTETPVVTTNPAPTNVTETNMVNTAAVSKVAKKIKHQKRTIRLDDFSRGRIPESIVIETEKFIPPVIVETNKPEIVPVSEVKVETITPPAVVEKPRRLNLSDFSRAPLRNPVKKVLVAKKSQ